MNKAPSMTTLLFVIFLFIGAFFSVLLIDDERGDDWDQSSLVTGERVPVANEDNFVAQVNRKMQRGGELGLKLEMERASDGGRAKSPEERSVSPEMIDHGRMTIVSGRMERERREHQRWKWGNGEREREREERQGQFVFDF
ncbi:hypothetical protein MRB53_016007 [Persea americana]|uniref:Uncharacterized protein n=1 Tax=Persea americana TaxID=3435 RepID=A0ACC2M1M3_PERAE|nr:hypothetical protein MRB53_016007 [Persea americana]